MKKLFFICALLTKPAQASIDIWKLFTLPERIMKPIVTKIVEQLSNNANKQHPLGQNFDLSATVATSAVQETNCHKIFKDSLILAQQ